MKVYIRSTGNISPQHSLDKDLFFQEQVVPTNNYFRCIEPDYDRFVDSKMIRRMSRIVKMGVAAAMTCLRNAAVEQPAAMITATAYGCLEDSSSFLRRMIEFEEKMLSPTAFIQSTHNTVGAQIALLLKCHHYNNTIVHRAFSFENALTESVLLLQEGTSSVLVGAIDEITIDRHAILSRFGLYKNGHIAGEGAAFFLLDSSPGTNALAVLQDVQTIYHVESEYAITEVLLDFMKKNKRPPGEIDLVLTSEENSPLMKSTFDSSRIFPFNSLSGDFPTASGFALWFASMLLKEQRAPVWTRDIDLPLKNVLIYTCSETNNHSFILISAVE